MKTVRASASPWTVACLAVAALFFGPCLHPAAANPVPPVMELTHVHPDDGGSLCASPVLSSCADIVQVTDVTGRLAFDFIAHDLMEGHGIDEICGYPVQFTVQWPEDWGFVRAEACGSGAVDVVHEGRQVVFSIDDLGGAPREGMLMSMARVVLDVTSEGRVRRAGGSPVWFTWTDARAGVECGTCVMNTCDEYYIEYPDITPSVTSLSAEPGGQATATFHVCGGYSGYQYEVSAPWMTTEAVIVSDETCTDWEVTLHADAAGLDPGLHEGWVEVHSGHCYDCEHVLFTVEGTSPARSTTWGRLKRRFR